MKHIDCIQGSPEWLTARLGIPTASEFDKIITAVKHEPTKSQTRKDYQIYLLTERILQVSLSTVTTPAMLHGNDWEPKARAAYELQCGIDVEICGFCTNDEGTAGASPDFLIGTDGTGEIKNPLKPEIHVARMVSPAAFSQEHFVQTQGQLYITQRKWTDLISYWAGLPMVVVRQLPDPVFQEKLDAALTGFIAELAVLFDRAKAEGWIKEIRSVEPSADFMSFLGKTEADLDQWIEATR